MALRAAGLLLLLAPLLAAQTTTQTISLGNGWNAVWLEVAPVYPSGHPRAGKPKGPADVFGLDAAGTLLVTQPAGSFQDDETLSGHSGGSATANGVPAANSTYQALSFDSRQQAFQTGQILTGESSGATATIHAVVAQNTSGILALSGVSGAFQDDETIRDAAGGRALANGTLSTTYDLGFDALTGGFSTGEDLTGNASGAQATVLTVNVSAAGTKIRTVVSPRPLATLSEFYAAAPPTSGTPSFNREQWEQWSVGGMDNNLATVTGNRAYLIETDATGTIPPLSVTGEVRFFHPAWTPDRYNLVGFAFESPPTFSAFFGPSGGRHPLSRIFQLQTDGTWQKITSGAAMASHRAYWIFSDGPSDYMGPVAVDFDGDETGLLHFGSPDEAITVGTAPDEKPLNPEALVITNLTAAPVTPALQDGGPPNSANLELYPISPNPGTLSWGHQAQITPSNAALGESVAASSSSTITLGARFAPASTETALTNLYRLRPGGGAVFWLPVRALKSSLASPSPDPPASPSGSLAGLWVGDVVIDHVTSLVEAGAPLRPAAGSAPLRLLLHADAAGNVALLSQVTLMQTRTADPAIPPEPVLVVDPARIPFFEGIRERSGKRVGIRLESVAFDLPRKIDATSQSALIAQHTELSGDNATSVPDFLAARDLRPATLAEVYHLTWPLTGSLAPGGTLRTPASSPLQLDPFHRSNPFRHAFHKQHHRGPAITRSFSISFDSSSPGLDLLPGVYEETLSGVTKSSLTLTGPVRLRRVSTVSTTQ